MFLPLSAPAEDPYSCRAFFGFQCVVSGVVTVDLQALFLGGSKNGILTTVAGIEKALASITYSMKKRDPSFAYWGGIRAIAMYFLSSGDHMPLVPRPMRCSCASSA